MLMEFKSQPERRIVVVKTIDRLFFEKRNAKRCHKRAYELFIHPLYGLCEESNRNYLKQPDDLLQKFPLPDYLSYLIKLVICLVKNLPLPEVARILRWLYNRILTAIEDNKQEQVSMTASTIINRLTESVKPVQER